MDEMEIERIARYIEGLENGFDDWDCCDPGRCRELIKLHLTIERLAHMIGETKDGQLRSTLAILHDKALTCKQWVESKLAVHS